MYMTELWGDKQKKKQIIGGGAIAPLGGAPV